jgi:peroxiredoxin
VVGPAPQLGTDAPEVALKALDGKDVKLSAFETKKPVLVVFWAAWCPEATRAIKEINKDRQAYKDAGVEILTIATDKDVKAVSSYEKIQKIVLPTVHDADKKVQNAYGITIVPTVCLVDKAGKVVQYYKVFRGKDKLLADVKALK